MWFEIKQIKVRRYLSGGSKSNLHKYKMITNYRNFRHTCTKLSSFTLFGLQYLIEDGLNSTSKCTRASIKINFILQLRKFTGALDNFGLICQFFSKKLRFLYHQKCIPM